MELTKADRKDMMESCGPSDKDSGPRYPWGLSISLDNESLEKLGIEMPKVGAAMTLTARVTVTSCSARQYDRDGKAEMQRDCSLQITDMALETGGDSEDEGAADALYDGNAKE
jgi:hypothetical protein